MIPKIIVSGMLLQIGMYICNESAMSIHDDDSIGTKFIIFFICLWFIVLLTAPILIEMVVNTVTSVVAFIVVNAMEYYKNNYLDKKIMRKL